MTNITLYISDTSHLSPSDEGLLSLMCDERRAKIDALIPEKAKKESMGVELLLIHALRDIYTPPLDIRRTEKGKPYIEGAEVQFSLAHSNGYAVCAVSDCEVGVDAEKICELSESMQRRILSEYDDCKSAVHAWSAKEAFVKLTGEGLGRTDLTGIHVSGGNVREGNVSAYLWQTEIDDMVCSVCCFSEFEAELTAEKDKGCDHSVNGQSQHEVQ